jgi:hypothetical protein
MSSIRRSSLRSGHRTSLKEQMVQDADDDTMQDEAIEAFAHLARGTEEQVMHRSDGYRISAALPLLPACNDDVSRFVASHSFVFCMKAGGTYEGCML